MAFHLKRSDSSSSSMSTAPTLTQKKLDLRPPISEKRKRDITEKIAEFVALDMRPVNIVEGDGFKEAQHPEPIAQSEPIMCLHHDNNDRRNSASQCFLMMSSKRKLCVQGRKRRKEDEEKQR
ncbi:uncharacterized protein V6R79_000632 [Siganus canaliculatus]